MRCGITLAALSLSLFLASSRAQPGGEIADQDPIAFFANLAQLPPEQQDAFLAMAGQAMMQNDPDIDCNIFGGEDACKTMSSSSKFANSCTQYRPDLKVDCVYYSASEEHLEEHPGDALQKYLGAAYNSVSQHCPQCMTSLQALWCVQALPECGSFQTHVHKAIFPAILAAKKAEDAGQPQSIAIAESVPGLVAAMSKTMACKEMCEAAVNTCSCKVAGEDGLTFGEAIENAEKADEGFKELGLETLGDDFRDTLFRDIWDHPLCEIFTAKDDPDFAGFCDEDVIGDKAVCTSDAFCEGLSDDQRMGTEAIIATQLARSVFAFVEGPAGVISQRTSVTDVAKNDWAPLPKKKPGTGVVPPSSTTSTSTSSTTSSGTTTTTTTATASDNLVVEEPVAPSSTQTGSSFGAAFGIILMMVVLAGVAAFGWKKYQEHKATQRYSHYGPLGGMEEYGDDGIPLQ